MESDMDGGLAQFSQAADQNDLEKLLQLELGAGTEFKNLKQDTEEPLQLDLVTGNDPANIRDTEEPFKLELPSDIKFANVKQEDILIRSKSDSNNADTELLNHEELILKDEFETKFKPIFNYDAVLPAVCNIESEVIYKRMNVDKPHAIKPFTIFLGQFSAVCETERYGLRENFLPLLGMAGPVNYNISLRQYRCDKCNFADKDINALITHMKAHLQ